MLGKHPVINYKLALNETFLFSGSIYITTLLRVASKLWFSCLGSPGSWDYKSVFPASAFSFIQASSVDWLEKQGLSSTGPGSLLPHVILHHVPNRSRGLTNFRVSPCRHDNRKVALWTSNWTQRRDHMGSLPASIIKFPIYFISTVS